MGISNKVEQTNAVFAKQNDLFIKACELARIKPTARQASKFRNGQGKAFPFKGEAGKQGKAEEN